MSNIAWIAPLVIALVFFALAIWLVILFLSSRGHFMFLHCVALNTAEVQVPWSRYGEQATSLFWVRLVLSLIGLAAVLPLVGVLVAIVLGMVVHQTVSAGGIVAAGALVLSLVIVSAVCWVVSRVLHDFVVPVQFLRRSNCAGAWREVKGLLQSNVGNLMLYLLFRIVLAVGIAVLVLALIVVTCCIAGCLFALPYLGTVALLPILVFERAYSLHYLAQFGPDFDVFSPPLASV